MKNQTNSIITALTACACGALPYDPGVNPKGQVLLVLYRKRRYSKDSGWSVVCTRCGRVGERGSSQIDAAARWSAGHLKYGPPKEEKYK